MADIHATAIVDPKAELHATAAEAEARAQDLGHGARAHHPSAPVQRVERGQVLALEAQLAVGVVFQDQRVVLVRQRDQLLTPPARHGRPSGVLKVDDRVDELAALALTAQPLELHVEDRANVRVRLQEFAAVSGEARSAPALHVDQRRS